MRYCKKCDRYLPPDSFYKTYHKSGSAYYYCIECNRAKTKAYKLSHPENRKYWSNHNRKERDRRYREKTKSWIFEYKSCHPCPCGESDPVALDFHHLNPLEKNGNKWDKKSIPWVKAEAEKCIVLCSNCHRKGHAGRPRPEHVPYFKSSVVCEEISLDIP